MKPAPVRPGVLWALIVALGLLYASLSSGLTSSNDGSHVALGRALALRHETPITQEVGLTLWVDRARRGGTDYSDRPPGTAFAALGALWVGALFDPAWGKQTAEALRAGKDPRDVDALVIVRPATDRYLATYGARRMERKDATSPNLIALQGTALLLSFHVGLIGGLGLAGLLMLLRQREVDAMGQVIVVIAIGAGTLWGPYSTMLFSHATAGTMLIWHVWALSTINRDTDTISKRRTIELAVLAGLTGAWAVSCDYLLLLAIIPLTWLSSSARQWPWILAGALPIAIATALYHQAAFGSVLSIGYDHHASFDFAQSRAQTFSGNPLQGLWTLWGAGEGAGVLVLAPVALVAAVGLRDEARLALGLAPWAIALCLHQTPTGGAGQDHRYLVPAMALLGVGLGHVWKRITALPNTPRIVASIALVLLMSLSAILTWSHFFSWRG